MYLKLCKTYLFQSVSTIKFDSKVFTFCFHFNWQCLLSGKRHLLYLLMSFLDVFSSEKPKSRKSSSTSVATASSRPIITIDHPFNVGVASSFPTASTTTLSGSPVMSSSSNIGRQRKTSYVKKMWNNAMGKEGY